MEKFEQKAENEVEKYLSNGEQTITDQRILDLAQNIKGNAEQKISQILEIIGKLEAKTFDVEEFRKRTAAQILESGYITGCSDAGLVYVCIARSANLPSKYVETIDEEWLRNGGKRYSGHIYSQCYDFENKKWIWVDPANGKINQGPRGRVIYKEGLDSWNIGIIYFYSLKNKFDLFREYWLSVEGNK